MSMRGRLAVKPPGPKCRLADALEFLRQIKMLDQRNSAVVRHGVPDHECGYGGADDQKRSHPEVPFNAL
jgi:hypothetical protein